MRAECLDWLLITGRGHLQQVLRVYIDHDNIHRPHRALRSEPPVPPAGPTTIRAEQHRVHRRDRLGGLLHEYHRQAARTGFCTLRAPTRSTPPGPTCLGGWAGTARPRSPTSARPPWRRRTPSGTSSGWVAEPRAQRTGDVEDVAPSRLWDLLSSAVPWMGSRAPNRATDCRAMPASRLLLKAGTHAHGRLDVDQHPIAQ